MRTVRSIAFALFCLVLLATVVMPAVRAQRDDSVERRARDMRTLAQRKINPRGLTAIYHRRGDAKGKVVPAGADRVQVTVTAGLWSTSGPTSVPSSRRSSRRWAGSWYRNQGPTIPSSDGCRSRPSNGSPRTPPFAPSNRDNKISERLPLPAVR